MLVLCIDTKILTLGVPYIKEIGLYATEIIVMTINSNLKIKTCLAVINNNMNIAMA